jgi:CRP-like cAMP-binding protein
MDEPYAAIIAGFSLFQGFTVPGAQRSLERGEVREYSTGERIFTEGDPSASVMLVLRVKNRGFR